MVSARLPLSLLAAVLAAAGCSTPSREEPSGSGLGSRPTPTARLEIEVDDGRGGSARASLTCAPGADRTTGYLRLADATDLCRRLPGQVGLLTSPPPRDRVCAQVFGGPAEARIRGSLAGRPVDRKLSRTDACKIADWERVDFLLPDRIE